MKKKKYQWKIAEIKQEKKKKRVYHDQLHANKSDHLEEMDNFLENQNTPRWNKEERVCRKATYFGMLIVYPVILLNSLINLKSICAASLGFSVQCTIYLHGDNFTSFLNIVIYLHEVTFLLFFFHIITVFFFDGWISVARTSKTMWNKNDESED